MILSSLDISGFRNIKQLSIKPRTGLNLITGTNGSGKSTILEAIHCLATGHSFRTRKPRELISHEEQFYRLTASFSDSETKREHRAGLERSRDGGITLRLDFEAINSQSEITRLLPVKTLTPDSHQLIQEGPELRRQFLDWGLFHVEHTYLDSWKKYKRSLSQRNQLLREQSSDRDIEIWNTPLSDSAENINELRHAYVLELADALKLRLLEMDVKFHVELRYRSGWDTTNPFIEVLASNLITHRRIKTTTDGPHRAEIIITVGESTAKQVLSRGEQKVLVYALHLAQLDLLHNKTDSRAIVLCDDLTSELDNFHTKALIDQLFVLGGQIFVTGVDLTILSTYEHGMFHMEHGNIERDYNQVLTT